MKLSFVEDATDELVAAIEYYERERPGLGFEFYSSVEVLVELADSFPRSGSPLSRVPRRFDARMFVLRTFPFALIVATIQEQRVVAAVAHASRKPDYWKPRLAAK